MDLPRRMDLSVDLAGIRLRNPTVLASGILDETGASMRRVAEAGAGAVVTKSIGSQPREGNPNPSVVELDGALLNAVGLPNPGIDAYGAEMEEALKGGVPVIGSVFGGDASEFARLAGRMEDYGAAAVELNLSCPHAKGYGTEIGSDPALVEAVTATVEGAVEIPVFAKLSPMAAEMEPLAEAAASGGADGITAINTIRAMAIVPEVGRPLLANRVGGLSGPALKPIGVRCVYEIHEAVDLPIMGVGGISNARDALEYLMAGATAVQIGTAVGAGGPETLGRIARDLGDLLETLGHASVKEVIGLAHQ